LATSQIVIVVALVALLGVLHLIQWAVAMPVPAAAELPPLGTVLRDLAGGRDPWTRTLLATAIVAISFAALAPFLSEIGDALGRILPG
jgi:hypothetical protein